MRVYKLILLLALVAVQSEASVVLDDSLRTKWANGKKYVLHLVEPGETWTFLSARYGCAVDDLIRVNNGVELLKAGQIVQIPVSSTKQPSNPTAYTSKSQQNEVTHTVKKGETLFAISRKYGVSVSEIKRLNGILNEGIVEGRVLIIRKAQVIEPVPSTKPDSSIVVSPNDTAIPNNQPKPIEASPIPTEPTEEVIHTTKKIQSVRPKEGGKPIIQITETGYADLVQDNSLGPSNYYCLHRTAPINTIIKMTDNETGKSVYLKVMGNIPASEKGSVVIRLTNHPLKLLGNRNTPFLVEISYSILD
ncbi:MAG: LysM peptidoglycan-binding domain-containing protein [Bacteroidota bacterium]